MIRKPIPGKDEGQWGQILNDFLDVSHASDGKLKENSVTSSQLAPGSVSNAAIATSSVTNAKIADGTVSSAKLDTATRAALAKADTASQSGHTHDDRYIRTVNGTGPDGAGNVTVAGGGGGDGREVELQASATHVQWRYIGESSWTNLVALADLKGEEGANGRSVELQKTATHIQWRQADGTWTDLVAISDLKGDPGTTSWSGITDLPEDFPPESHSHSLADLDGSGATTGQAPLWNGSAWVPGAPGAGIPTGTLAARPTAVAAGADSIYLATDVGAGTLYISNGITWTVLSPVGPTEYRMSGKMLNNVLGSPTFVNNFGSGAVWVGWSLDQTALEAVADSAHLPADWQSMHIDIEWGNAADSTGDVLWRADVAAAGDGDIVHGGLATGTPAAMAAPDSRYVMKVSRLWSDVPIIPGESTWVRIIRVASDSTDTLPNDAVLLGVVLRKAS